jgi:hypothetical protein
MLATAVLVYIITFLINKKIDNSRWYLNRI